MTARLLVFCFRSLYREYGVAFLLRIVLAHPIATLRGVSRYARGPTDMPGRWKGGPTSLVGLGFCLKPLAPACPSGRANHNCILFESGQVGNSASCRDCLIREIGQRALLCGSPLYVMTSAQDILHDVLRPALEGRRFRTAILVMCRYSFEPMRLALAICGIEAQLIPFVHGDCRDYAVWRRADIGEKPERTVLDEASLRELMAILSAGVPGAPFRQYHRDGNLFVPC